MTLQRALVCVSLLGLIACARSDAAPKAKRPAPTTEPVAAVVLHVGGTTTVQAATGARFVAAVEHDLVRSDRLEPAEGAFTIVGLHNGYVVRVDDAGALAVKDILLLQAPPTTRPVTEQLAQLLDPAERRPGLEEGVADRAAAWRQMRRAGETSGSRSTPSGRDEAKAEEARESDAGGGAGRPSKRARRQGPTSSNELSAPAKDAPPPTAGAPVPASAPPPPAEPAQKTSIADATSPPPPPPAEPGVVVKAGPTVQAATPLSSAPFLGGEVRACLEQSARDVGVDASAVTLWLQVKGGVVGRVRFAGALPVSSCAAALQGRSVTTADGWLVVERAP